jgi:trehalose 2-sulfotransferase
LYGISSGYIVAALPRTGSFRFCEMIAATGQDGYPQEYGSIEDEATWRSHHGFNSHVAYFYEFFRLCSTPNGRFGCKLMWSQFAALRQDIAKYLQITGDGLSQFQSLLGPTSLIFLQRRNRIMQSISLCRALQTGAWSSRATCKARPHYDAAGISAALGIIEGTARLWEAFFADHRLAPYRLWYEDVAEGSVAGAFAHLGILHSGRHPGDGLLGKQADKISTEWYDRFCQEHSCEGLC